MGIRRSPVDHHEVSDEVRTSGFEPESPRAEFAARLTELFAAAGNPTLQRVATAAEQRMRPARAAGERGAGGMQRISDWRKGRNVPSRFETLVPVLVTLIELARARSGSPDRQLLDLRAWEQVWKAALRQPIPRRASAVVNALRRDIDTFVGRSAELDHIVAAAAPGRVVSIHTVDGMPGIGKTALVTRAAHVLAERFPDGQYFVELNAHTPGQRPATAADVLGTLLIDLGIDPRNLPEPLAARRDLWRDRLSGKRVLLVLDDALDHAQIEPLLPTNPACLTLITSRRRLVALDGAAPVTLDTLAPRAAIELFIRLSGRGGGCEVAVGGAPAVGSESDAGETESAAIAEMVRLCGYLPLAIVLLAGRLAHRPRWTVADLAAEFREAHDRLAELEAGPRAVRAAFTTSYRLLPPTRQRLFRRLGAHPGPDFDVYAAAALDDTAVADTRKALEELYIEHLIDETAPGRFRLHDLIREYAQSVLDDPGERGEAGERVLSYYLRTAHAAMASQRGGAGSGPDVPVLGGHSDTPVFRSFGAASGWLRLERANMLACLRRVSATGPLEPAIAMAKALVGELYLHGTWPHAVALQRRLAVAADTIELRSFEAFAVKDLGSAAYLADDYGLVATMLRDARDRYGADPASAAAAEQLIGRLWLLAGEFPTGERVLEGALARVRELGDRYQEGRTLSNLGWARHLRGDYSGAMDALRQAMAVQRAIGDDAGIALALNSLSWVLQLTGDRAAAIEMLHQAAEINRSLGRQAIQAFNLSACAWMHALQREYIVGIELLRESRTLFGEVGNRSGEAFTSTNIAFSQYLRGRYAEASEEAERAYAIYTELGNPDGAASALNVIGRVGARTGELDSAIATLTRALEIYRTTGNRVGEADSLGNLGWAHHESGSDVAPELLGAALAQYRALGHHSGVCEALNRVGGSHRRTGDLGAALSAHEEALELAHAIGSCFEEARAFDGIGRSRALLGDGSAAVVALDAAVDCYRRLAMAEADSAAALLESLGSRAAESAD